MLVPHPDHISVPIEVPTAPSRPGHYHFDLFHQPGQRPELDRCLLSELSYTVFDTETTGLEPSAGDEIISIGATRVVSSRLLHGEVFDQLIDPGRPLAPESVRIHGIEPAMLAGQSPIARVLPQLHRFCEDTVLVAHNAAYEAALAMIRRGIRHILVGACSQLTGIVSGKDLFSLQRINIRQLAGAIHEPIRSTN